jgi:TatD DNase family protein
LLIETDAPYLTPHPHRGERNEPLYTTFVAAKMGELSALETDKIESITTENAKKLFGI